MAWDNSMKQIGEMFQTADGRVEKHVPVIDCPEQVPSEELFAVTISVGKEVAHPNTVEHHITWICVYFQPEGEKYPHQVGHFEFSAHGESIEGPDWGPVYTNHEVSISLKISKPGVLYATSFCNIHGPWQSAKEVALINSDSTGKTGNK